MLRRGRSPLSLLLRATPELRDVFKADDFLKKYLKTSVEQRRDEVLGDAIVFAYRAGPPGKPERDEGMLLVRARRPEMLAALMERLNKVQKESGDLKSVEEREHDGVKYVCRVERKEQNFYYLRGPVLLFSAQESLLRRALVRERQARPGEESAAGKQLRLLGADRALLALLLNPRGFDAVLEAKLARSKGTDAAFSRRSSPAGRGWRGWRVRSTCRPSWRWGWRCGPDRRGCRLRCGASSRARPRTGPVGASRKCPAGIGAGPMPRPWWTC